MKTLALLLLASLPLNAATPLDPAQIAPDIETRLARFQKVEMPFSYAGMSARERRVVDEALS